MENNNIYDENLTAYEDMIVALIANKSSEEIDNFKPDQETIDRAHHFFNHMQMGNKLNSEDIQQNYLKAIIQNNSDIQKFEDEFNYQKKYDDDAFFKYLANQQKTFLST